MISAVFHLVFLQPLYNALVFLVSILPFHDFGLAIILLTAAVRLVLLPLTHRSVVAQRKMKEIEPHVAKIKERFKDERHKNRKEEQAKEIMKLYKDHGVNPFSGFLMLLLQFPILIALFLLLRDGIVLRPDDLYPFVNFPDEVKTVFLGVIDMAKPSYFLAVLAGLSQFIQLQLATPKIKNQDSEKKTRSFGEELQKNMSVQMKYVMPLFIIFISTRFSSGLPLYWTVSNVFAIVHEIVVARKAKKIYERGTNSNNKNLNQGASGENDR